MREFIRELIETVLLSIAVFLALHLSVQNFRVEGTSMDPTLTEGQYIVANKIIYSRVARDSLAPFVPFIQPSGEGESFYAFHPPMYGEILIFNFPSDDSRDLVKRVIGLPGDIIRNSVRASYSKRRKFGRTLCPQPGQAQYRPGRSARKLLLRTRRQPSRLQ